MARRIGKDFQRIGACLSRTEAKPSLYCRRRESKLSAGDSRRGRESRSETKASKSMKLTARNGTDLIVLCGVVILSEHWTAWWSENREVTEASNTKLMDSRVKIRSRVCHFPDFAHLVGALTSWEKLKETNSFSMSSAFVSPDPTWMLKSPVITTSPEAWLGASNMQVNSERKT
jgi:hypothetical protein